MEDAAVVAWASVRGYFTPATLFLVLNLVIGTIALTSRSHQRRRREHHNHYDYAHHQVDHQYHQAPPLDPLQHQQEEYHHYQYQPPPLARTSSVLDRLRSIGLYRFRSGDFPPEYAAGAAANSHHDAFAPVVEEEAAKQYARSRSEPAPAREDRRVKKSGTNVVRKSQATPAVAEEHEAVDARADRDFMGTLSFRQQEPASPPKAEYHRYQQEAAAAEYVPPPAPMRAPPPLSRTSSVLDRLRSLGLYSFLGAEQHAAPEPDAAFPAAAPPAGAAAKKQTAHTHYDRSRSEPAREQGTKEKTKQAAAEPKMSKSSSATRKPAAAPSLVPQQSINTRAEAFIDSFRREQSQKHLHHHAEDADDEHVVPPPSAPLARTSSVLDRLRSFGLYLRSGDPVPDDPYDKAAEDLKKQQAAAQYGRSRSEPAREQGKKKKQSTDKRMSKASSEADMAEEAAASAPADECVDARADDFINKFRQQLQLQRLDSLLNYKEVLNRKQ